MKIKKEDKMENEKEKPAQIEEKLDEILASQKKILEIVLSLTSLL